MHTRAQPAEPSTPLMEKLIESLTKSINLPKIPKWIPIIYFWGMTAALGWLGNEAWSTRQDNERLREESLRAFQQTYREDIRERLGVHEARLNNHSEMLNDFRESINKLTGGLFDLSKEVKLLRMEIRRNAGKERNDEP